MGRPTHALNADREHTVTHGVVTPESYGTQ